jgi:alpha-aminoadipate carrier protein LysW
LAFAARPGYDRVALGSGIIIPLEGGGMAVCPECEADIELDEYDVDKGEVISCPECGIELEVVGLSPLELDVAPQEGDEWEE